MIRKILTALAGLFLLPACASATDATPAPKPGLWKVADKDTTIYLFGTVHMLPADYAWRTRAFDGALAKADTLMLEIVAEDDPQTYAKLLQRIGFAPGQPPLLDRVPADKRATLKAMIDKAQLPMATLDKMETWAASLTLAATALQDMDIRAAHGVEKQLSTNFAGKGKTIGGLETTEQQLGFFDALPEAAQRQFLESVVDSDKDAKEQFAAMIAAWSSGDTDKIAMTFDDELRMSPELSEAILKRRNANWAEWLKKRLDTPGTVMVAVGAGHLAGDDSVQAMLARDGLQVTRVQ